MSLEVGALVEGKVTGITKFGAFVSLPEGKSGLVHISEIANSYVNDINEHLSVGQAVKVMVLNITPDGKINLSIKKAAASAAPRAGYDRRPAERPAPAKAAQTTAQIEQSSADKSFEDRLKKFMQESDSRIADNRIYSEHRQRNRRR